MHGGAPLTSRRCGPWFRWHPLLAVGVALGLYAAVFALRLSVTGTTEAITLLFVLPIALLAVAFGARAGVAAGAAGVLLVVTWVAISDVTLTPLAWVTRATPLLLLGGLVGSASDRLRDAADAERLLLLADLRERQAAEINDAIIQRLAAAKWSLEAHDGERSLELLSDSIETAQALVADLLSHHDDATVVQPLPVVPRPAY